MAVCCKRRFDGGDTALSRDYYEVLGVERDAADEDVKKAFRHKARTLHPDVNKDPDAEERFKELNEAYDVLSDRGKRAQYDRFGSVSGSAGGGYQNVDFDDLFGGGFGMGDIFSTFFGGMGGGQGRHAVRREGRDMGVGLRLTLEEVAAGVKKEIVYDRLAPCEDCHGTGAAEGGHMNECSTCHGTGRVVTVQRTILGDMQTATSCPSCGGMGSRIDKPCPECEGQGRVPDRQHVTVEVPAGIRDGQQLRLTGYGEAGLNGAPAGNLIVTVRIAEHEFFQREGDNLHTRASVSIAQASLGADIQVPGILSEELVDVHIPEGCQDDQIIRVRSKGAPRFRSDNRGDLLIHVDVVVPRNLTAAQRSLLEQLAVELGSQVSAKRTPFQRLRDALS
jgi:molecular chaperone DnaJ